MHTTRPSLRSNFAWTFAGNAVHGASQWAILSLIAKLGSAEMLGQYALAVAIAMPVSMLAHLNLRAVLATDVGGSHDFADYLAVRMVAALTGMVVFAAIAAFSGYSGPVPAMILLVGVALIAETFSDLYYAWMQRRERMDLIARSMILRSALTLTAVGLTLWWTRSVIGAGIALAAGRIVPLLAYDLPASRVEIGHKRNPGAVFRAALPLGAVLMLSSLTTNVPRYAVEYYFGTPELGAFAAVASFVTVGTTITNALGQSATTRLARCFEVRDYKSFRILTCKLVAFAAGLGISGTAVAYLVGERVLSLIYRPEYGAYRSLLVIVMIAGTFVYVAIALGYAITSTRTFGAQPPLLLAALCACALTSFLAVPVVGLTGAAVALGIAGCVQITGQLVVLSRAL